MAQKSKSHTQATGTQFLDQMSEFMEDLSTIRALAEKLAAKMEEMSKTAPRNGKREA